MSIIDLSAFNMNEVPETGPAEAGEYKLRVVNVINGDDKNGNPYIMPFFEIIDVDTAEEFGYFIGLPYDGMKGKDLLKCQQKINTITEMFGLNPDTFETDDMIGQECWAILDIGEYKGNPINNIKSFVNGR